MSQSNIDKNTIIKTAGTIAAAIVSGVVIFKEGVKKGLKFATQAMEAAKSTIKIKQQENEHLRRENDKLRKESNK